MTDGAIEDEIFALLARRSEGATICPSEVARALHTTDGGADEPDDGWRDLMDPVRAVARRLVSERRLEITQKGEVVDPETARGAIRLRLPRSADAASR